MASNNMVKLLLSSLTIVLASRWCSSYQDRRDHPASFHLASEVMDDVTFSFHVRGNSAFSPCL